MTASTMKFCVILISVASSIAFQHGRICHRTISLQKPILSSSNIIWKKSVTRHRTSAIQMQPSENEIKDKRRRTSLKISNVATLESIDEIRAKSVLIPSSETVDAVTKVLSASLLVTGNTVGSSIFVLPEAVRSVGMAWGSVLFVGVYLYNLLSGLMIANVAINLHENSDCEVPSSFKDFADCAMQTTSTSGTVIGGASLLMNSCFLSYGMVQVGSFVSQLLPGMNLDPTISTLLYSIMLAVAFCTTNNEGINKLSNVGVMVLFSSFLALLLPSLGHCSGLMDVFLTPGTASAPDVLSGTLSVTIPLILSNLIYQNIVPSVTKLLDFDRTKSTIAIALGSFIPLIMYVAWCYAVLGGGVDKSLSSGAGGVMFAAFTASSFVGSSIGCVMSLAEEYESAISTASNDSGEACTIEGNFSTQSVLMSVLPPAAVSLFVSSGGDEAFTAPLHISGAIIAPFLYGLLPIILLKSVQDEQKVNNIPRFLLGVGTCGLLGNELVQDCAHWF